MWHRPNNEYPLKERIMGKNNKQLKKYQKKRIFEFICGNCKKVSIVCRNLYEMEEFSKNPLCWRCETERQILKEMHYGKVGKKSGH